MRNLPVTGVPGSARRARLIGLIILGLACFFAPARQAFAAADSGPKAEIIWDAGKVKVFALFDRTGDMPAGIFQGPASEQERDKYFVNGKAPAGINAFLVRDESEGGLNILVDAGFGEAVPGRSSLLDSLTEAGVSPDQINMIMLTHMHTDHIGGLVHNNVRVFDKGKIMVARAELDYWLEQAETNPANNNAALAKKVKEAYGHDFLKPFDPRPLDSPEVLAPPSYIDGVEVTPVDASGHTPGHTVYRLVAYGKEIWIIGDLVHAAALQFPLPEECAQYDMDMPQAVKARKAILGLAADRGAQIAGMHIPFPCTGFVEKEGQGFRLSR